MQTKRELSKELNNKGLTLVEVVVAVTMLTVVVTAMVSVMVATARYNAKADAVHQATIAAESIMEKFKAYDVEELCQQFHAGSFQGASVAADGGMTVYGKTVAGGSADVNLYSSGEFVESPSGEYLFSLTKLQTEYSQYNATVNVIPYKVGTAYAEKQSLADMTQLHPHKDAIYRSSVIHDTKAIDQIENKFQSEIRETIAIELNGGIDKKRNDYDKIEIVNDYIKIMDRVTTINITKDNSLGGYTKAVLTMRYDFIIEGYPYHTDTDTLGSPTGTGLNFPVDGSMYSIDVIVDIPTDLYYVEFYNNPTDVGLERVFFYYYPVYKVSYKKANPDFKDIINITTSGFDSDEQVEVYVLKQVPEGADMITLNLDEATYIPTVTGTSNIKLIHNFNDNIGGTSVPSTPTISGFYSKEAFLNDSSIEDNFCLMYKMELEITDINTGQVVAKLQGTKND